jgi:hypothetical protein
MQDLNTEEKPYPMRDRSPRRCPPFLCYKHHHQQNPMQIITSDPRAMREQTSPPLLARIEEREAEEEEDNDEDEDQIF